MKIAIWLIAAVSAYLITALNPAIIMSKLIYHRDIRNEGSGNPGFTNFKRVFGSKYAWWVFILDIAKTVLIEVLFGFLFQKIFGDRKLGVAFTAVFAMLGHAFPVWYGFKGGKGFLVCFATACVLDWRAGLAAALIMVATLLTIHLMSLSSILTAVGGWIVLLLTGASPVVLILYGACVIFMIVRHRANIVRLCKGTESKFYLGHKKEK